MKINIALIFLNIVYNFIKMNRIFCIGLGKLGLIFSQILANNNNIVYGYDVDKSVHDKIINNEKDNEPFLNTLIKKNRKRFFFTNKLFV